MKWFQLIECDNTVNNPLVCDSDNFEEYGLDEFSFKKGQNIEIRQDDIYMQAKKKKNNGNPDDVLQNYLMIPIYSQMLVKTLEASNIKGIQYISIIIKRPNNECITGFYVANVLNFVEAFDFSKSDYSRFSEEFPNPNKRGMIAGVKRFVLKKDNLKEFDIIRLKEYKLCLFVSEKFKNEFEKNGFTGYSFRGVELS